MDLKSKKILLINATLVGENSGTGVTLRNIFSNFSQNNLMQLCVRFKTDNDVTTIKNTIFIDKHNLPLYYLISKIRKINKKNAEDIKSVQNISVSIPNKNLNGILRNVISGLLDMESGHLSANLINEISTFQPDLIYTMGSSIRVHTFVNSIAKLLHIPVILHLMDDWPDVVYTSSLLSYLPRFVLLQKLKETNSLSVVNFAISKPLCNKYSVKYHKQYIELMNPAINIKQNISKEEDDGRVRLLYAGSLSLGRAKSLLEIAKAVYDVQNSTIKTTFDLYVPEKFLTDSLISEFCKYNATLHSYLPYELLQKKYCEVDVLVHTESFEEEYIAFTKLSLSTKIPEYMGAGKPILAYLPLTQYGYMYIKNNNIGIVAHNFDTLQQVVKTLVDSDVLRNTIAQNALDFAKLNHSIESIKRKFEYAIKEILSK